MDPVRFIGNHSSGKMGFAIAETFADKGAQVFIVAGPCDLVCSNPLIKRTNVVSANEMFKECLSIAPQCDIIVMAAAVADYSPVISEKNKIKKKNNLLTIELCVTPDILAELGKRKTQKQFIAGFALETDNELNNAIEKKKKKNLDMIVLNSMKDKGAGFGYDTNKITIIGHNNKICNFELKSKHEVAIDIVNEISKQINSRKT